MRANQPSLSGYPIDTHLRDSRAVVVPLRTSVHRWLRRGTRAA